MEEVKQVNTPGEKPDISFRGFFSYRHVRILGWIFLVLAQVGAILAINIKINPDSLKLIEPWKNVLSFLGNFPIPLFMLANFSAILQKRGNYKSMFLLYGGAALGCYLLSNFLVFHYGFRFMNRIEFVHNWHEVSELFGSLLPNLGRSAYTLNIFIDLLLCSLLFFFATYEPKTVFTGKKVLIFRAMMFIPIAYEIAAIFVKYYIHRGFDPLVIPSYCFFLLPNKPPFIFLAFLALVVILEILMYRNKKKHNRTSEALAEYMKTNRHSLRVSFLISVIFFVVASIDIAIVLPLYKLIELGQTGIDYEGLSGMGMGGSIALVLIIPVVLLFSYSKSHSNKIPDVIIPVLGIAFILLVYIEGLFEVLVGNLPLLFEKLQKWIEKLFPSGDEPEGPVLLAVRKVIEVFKDFK